MVKIAAALACPPVLEAVAERLTALFAPLGIPGRLRDLDVPRMALDEIAAHAITDWFLKDNPRPVADSAAIAAFLEQAW
jgi:alcohol dehydrogenase class IV